MKFEEIKNHYGDSFTIEGRNLPPTKGSFKLLSEHFSKEKDEIMSSLKYLEKMYLNAYNQMENDNSVKPLNVVDGKVVLDDSLYFHRAISDYKILKSMSVSGVIASEWFGVLEAELEGRFCTFLNKVLSEEEVNLNPIPVYKYHNEKFCYGRPGTMVLYFDTSHPLMKRLLEYDFFEYNHQKKINPNRYDEFYPQEIVDLYEDLIIPLSPAGLDFHEKNYLDCYFWKAIPGGIPPQLINGVSIHSKSEIIEHLDELSELLPNAVFFNENSEVLAYGKNVGDKTGKTM